MRLPKVIRKAQKNGWKFMYSADTGFLHGAMTKGEREDCLLVAEIKDTTVAERDALGKALVKVLNNKYKGVRNRIDDRIYG